MICKPGDLAIVVRDLNNIGALGKLVEVLYAAPAHTFVLPDGYLNQGEDAEYWVIRLLGSKLWAPIGHLVKGRLAEYGTAYDGALRPIRGLPVDEKIDEEITA